MSNYIVEVTDTQPIVEVLSNTSVVVEVGIQGPPGVNGADGSGAHVGSTPPPGSTEGTIWYDTVAKQLKVYRSTIWEPLPYTEELNGTFGSVTLNAGYF